MYHADEPGNVHCHSVVIPIDDKGHLNARFYLTGPNVMTRLQDDYAKAMEKHGLERGVKGSRAKHTDIKKFYAKLNQALDEIPLPKIGESMEDYMKRGKDILETIRANDLRENLEWRRKEQAKLDTLRENDKKMIDVYADGKISSIQGDLAELSRVRDQSIEKTRKIRRETAEAENELDNITKKVEKKKEEYYDVSSSVLEMRSKLALLKKALAFYRDVHDPLEDARQSDPELAARVDAVIMDLAKHRDEHMREAAVEDIAVEENR